MTFWQLQRQLLLLAIWTKSSTFFNILRHGTWIQDLTCDFLTTVTTTAPQTDQLLFLRVKRWHGSEAWLFDNCNENGYPKKPKVETGFLLTESKTTGMDTDWCNRLVFFTLTFNSVRDNFHIETLTFVRRDDWLDIKADDIPSNANGDGKLHRLSIIVVGEGGKSFGGGN